MSFDDHSATAAENLRELLERTHGYDYVNELFSNEHSKRKLSFDSFLSIINRLNGIAREIPIQEREPDGDGVEITSPVDRVILPLQRDKEPLLKGAFEAAQKLSRSDASYLLPLIINAVHLFADGNGRTSRMVHLLVREHENKEQFNEELEKALRKDGRFKSFDNNTRIIDFEIEQKMLQKNGWDFDRPVACLDGKITSMASGVKPGAISDFYLRHIISYASDDRLYMMTAIYNSLDKEKFEKILSKESESKIDIVENQAVLDTSDFQGIIEAYFELKKKHVEMMVDMFVHPDEYEAPDHEGKSLKDWYIERVEKNLEELQNS